MHSFAQNYFDLVQASYKFSAQNGPLSERERERERERISIVHDRERERGIELAKRPV